MGFEFPEVTGWIRAVAADFKLVREMGLRETGILTSCSDYHIFLKLGKTRRQAMDDYLAIAAAALDAGVRIRCHLEDATRADFYGFVVPFVARLMRMSTDARVPIKIRVCDTMGFGVPYPGVALPRSVPKLISGLRDECGVPSECLEWHGHNDFHKVLANATAAWLYGCAAANGTILGFGERTGNPPLEGLLMDYVALRGDANGADLSVITEIAEYFEREIGYRIPPNYPFVGRDFNVTRAGIHADGLLKDEEIYNVFDTTAILNRPPRVAVDKTSGTAGVAWWINSYYALPRDLRVSKRDDAVTAIARWVDDQYDDGRTTSISDEEMAAQAREHLPALESHHAAA
jgi:isopropylmalate/homocitrate/citramalate synthase